MTPKQIKQSIETGTLRLSFWQRFTHYSIVIYCAMLPVLFAFLNFHDYINDFERHYVHVKIWFYLVSAALSIFFYFLQRKRLQLTLVETTLNHAEILAVAGSIVKAQHWKLQRKNNTFFMFKTSPPLISGSWGEQITIIFSDNKMLINSICDPDKISSVVSYGNNKRNVGKILEEMRRLERFHL